MPTPQLPSSNPDASLTEIKDYLVGLTRYLNYLLSSLDTLNISRLDAKVIIANTITATKIAADTITANEIAANAITASEISAGAVTATKISVSQLSAISADLGTVNAGSITSNTTVNVGTSATIGDKLFLSAVNFGNGIRWGSAAGIEIYLDNGAHSLHITAPGGVYANGVFLG